MNLNPAGSLPYPRLGEPMSLSSLAVGRIYSLLRVRVPRLLSIVQAVFKPYALSGLFGYLHLPANASLAPHSCGL